MSRETVIHVTYNKECMESIESIEYTWVYHRIYLVPMCGRPSEQQVLVSEKNDFNCHNRQRRVRHTNNVNRIHVIVTLVAQTIIYTYTRSQAQAQAQAQARTTVVEAESVEHVSQVAAGGGTAVWVRRLRARELVCDCAEPVSIFRARPREVGLLGVNATVPHTTKAAAAAAAAAVGGHRSLQQHHPQDENTRTYTRAVKTATTTTTIKTNKQTISRLRDVRSAR